MEYFGIRLRTTLTARLALRFVAISIVVAWL